MQNQKKGFIFILFYALSGFAICAYFIWIRLLKERLPQPLSYSWNLWLFILYISVFLLCIYSLKQKFYPKESKNYIIVKLKNALISFMGLIIIWYENSLRIIKDLLLNDNPIPNYQQKIQPYLLAFFRKLAKSLPFFNTDNKNLLFIIFINYLPRLLISFFLFIDVIFVHKLYYFYKCIWLLLFPFFWNIFYSIVEYMYIEYMKTLYEVFTISHTDFTEEERIKKKAPHGGFYIDMNRRPDCPHNDVTPQVEQLMRDYYQYVYSTIKTLFLDLFDTKKRLPKYTQIQCINLSITLFYTFAFGYLIVKMFI